MDTPTLKAKVRNLEKEAKNIAPAPIVFSFEAVKEKVVEVVDSKEVYIYLPIIWLILLLLIRPKFLYSEVKVHDRVKMVFSNRKLLLYWGIPVLVACVGLYFYKRFRDGEVY